MKACLALRSVETVFRGVTPLRGAEPEACCRVSARRGRRGQDNMVHRMLVNVAGEGDCTKTREESRRELEIGLRRI